jgi:crotonobetainyl-CoA:carnitine CoA-transferase CaiB-like acyl-CoA transferase
VTGPGSPRGGVMSGVKVLEVAAWTFVPAAGAVLADWGADVIKVEHAAAGDPQRTISLGSVGARGPGGVSYVFEQPNRGKRSIGLDITSPEGRALLLELAADCDVFLTNLLPGSLERAGLTVEDVRAVNPGIIYARGTGQGVRGPDAGRGGFDSTAYFSRSGMAHMLTSPTAEWPLNQRPAFGDIVGGFAIAGGIAAALFQRATTGQPSVVDVSLLGAATWQMAPDLVATGLLGEDSLVRFGPENPSGALTTYYRTSDDRFLLLMMLQGNAVWPDLCTALERPDLAEDPRFATPAGRNENMAACLAALREVFAARPLAEWQKRLAGITGVWATVQTPAEVLADPQVVANGYLRPVSTQDGAHTYALVANPVQFDETPPDLVRAPDQWQHTDEVLAEFGIDTDRIAALRAARVIA